MGRSSPSASPREVCSPVPRGSRPPDEVALWGGTAGIQYDPCYHLACDTFTNINDFAYATNTNSVAYSTLQYAMNTEAVNGVRGKGNFKAKQQQGAAMAAKFEYLGPRAKR